MLQCITDHGFGTFEPCKEQQNNRTKAFAAPANGLVSEFLKRLAGLCRAPTKTRRDSIGRAQSFQSETTRQKIGDRAAKVNCNSDAEMAIVMAVLRYGGAAYLVWMGIKLWTVEPDVAKVGRETLTLPRTFATRFLLQNQYLPFCREYWADCGKLRFATLRFQRSILHPGFP